MGRWEPGAQQRLRTAALDLYLSRGFEQTTVADIADSVGLTERTFFRHFADKREVLFAGQEVLEQAFVDGVRSAPASATPWEMVASGLRESAGFFDDQRRPHSRRRQQVIEANPALQERELLKLAGLATTLAAALRDRGVADPTATLAAESGVTVFVVAFGRWIAPGEDRSLFALEDEGLAALRDLVR